MIVLPCTKTKAFVGSEELPAEKAYTGQMFLKGQAFALSSNIPYIILSAKYGWLRPIDRICNYEQTFLKTKPNYTFLKEQVRDFAIGDEEIIVLGGKIYSNVARKCFPNSRIIEPLKGLSLGFKLQLLGNHQVLLRKINELRNWQNSSLPFGSERNDNSVMCRVQCKTPNP